MLKYLRVHCNTLIMNSIQQTNYFTYAKNRFLKDVDLIKHVQTGN
jgi:hypothetical protein